LGLKQKNVKMFRGFIWGHEIPYAYAQSTFKGGFFFSLGPKIFSFLEAFVTICWCHWRFFKFSLCFRYLKN
jgi:hypothetical protein